MRQRLIILLVLLCLPLVVAFADDPTTHAPSGDAVLRPQASLIAYQPAACTELVETALTQIGNNCGGTARNEACYGYNRVDATFVEEVGMDVFVEPADRAELLMFASIQTTPLDIEANRWGVAVLNVQANLPNTVPGQGVIMLLFGDTRVENRVAPDQAFRAVDPITVTTNTRANIRSGASRRNNVIAAVNEGTELAADALNADGTWVRVVYDGSPGWISAELINAPDAIRNLPVVTEETRSTMQAFYFTTGIGQTDCLQAPDALLIQGPEGVTVDLQINEAEVSISSTVLLRTFIGEDGRSYMEITVIDGQAVVNNLVVPTGYVAVAPIGDPDDQSALASGFKTIDGEWESCRTLSDEERAKLLLLEGLPADVLNYLIDLPETAVGICAPPGTVPPSNTGGGGGGQSQVAGVDCSNFRPTSPLDGLPYGQTTFYWDAAPGATYYRVLIYDESGALVGTFNTSGPETTLIGDTAFGSGFTYSWEVQAFSGEQLACTTSRVSMFRAAPPPPPDQQQSDVSVPLCTITSYCNCDNVCDYIEYSNGGCYDCIMEGE